MRHVEMGHQFKMFFKGTNHSVSLYKPLFLSTSLYKLKLVKDGEEVQRNKRKGQL